MGSIQRPNAVNQSTYSKSQLNTIRIYKDRASYDYTAVHSVFASTFVSHVAFITSDEDGTPTPMNLPMTAVLGYYDPEDPIPDDDGTEAQYCRQQEDFNRPMDVYLHGNAAMMLRRAVTHNGAVKVCLTSTKVDGVVLHFTPNGHSLNYRSAVIHGTAEMVTSQQEKEYAMHMLTNHMIRRRWSSVSKVSPQAMKSVQIVKVVVRSASAKIRAKNMGIAKPAELGTRDDVYTGVIPLYEVLGEPIDSGYFPERPVQPHLEHWIAERNQTQKDYAVSAAQLSEEDVEQIRRSRNPEIGKS
ncbi:MAG: hypothetical protein M1834_005586 [Cirrosporium novae-zelandiae]|nr:MAG: hypothetical protein M1834_005586 [Cirrosporium novae-zelandiae]